MALRNFLVAAFAAFTAAIPAPAEQRATEPSVTTQNGVVVGTSQSGVDSFKGIPYALPPTGTRRLKPPAPITTSLGTITATGVPAACPQMLPLSFNTTGIPPNVLKLLAATPFGQQAPIQSEDCLTVNVQRPSNIKNGTKLPVVFWIYGGGFEFGSTSTYDATNFIRKSISLSAPVIYVAVNYRVAGFGFLAGKELQADGSTNLGLRDQRLALQWVADNIEAFGGDPDRVTIWGESAGSISVYDQNLINRGNNLYKGKPLFISAIMDSGTAVPTTDVASAKPQAIYDAVVNAGGCSSAADTLQCLRSLPYLQFYNAQNSVPSIFSQRSVDLSYLPRYDPNDDFFPTSPGIAGTAGETATLVPSIIGDQEDEGTLFALSIVNVTSTKALVDYLLTYFPLASRSQIQGLVDTYPEDPSAGSPFRTSILNQLYPGFKRNAAILGDLTFTLTRRIVLSILKQVYPNVPVWSYLASYGYGTPILGTFHATDIAEIYFGTPYPEPQSTIQTYYISFINYQDPNKISTTFPLINWPQWQRDSPKLLNLLQATNQIISDDFRSASAKAVENLKDVLAV